MAAGRIGITDYVQSTIAGRHNGAIRASANFAVNNINGLSREGSNSSLSNISDTHSNKFGTSLLAYPFDVDSDPSQGHYIMFNVKEIDAAKLKQIKARKSYAKILRNLQAEVNNRQSHLDQLDNEEQSLSEYTVAQQQINQDQLGIDIGAGTGFAEALNLDAPGSGNLGLNRSIQLTSRPTVRTSTSIALYMPPNVEVQYDVKYGDDKVGALAQIGLNAIEAFRGNDSTIAKFTKLKRTSGDLTKEGLTNVLNSTLDTVAPGAKTLQQLDTGKVITPRMELMFEGVGRRSFNYTFNFIPKSKGEAKMVERIVQAFKSNMMPDYTNDFTRREMKIPNTFDITYMYQNAENGFLNKISECFLTKADVKYGGERFTAYESTKSIHGEGPPPQRTTLTLAFTELEVLSKKHVEQGF